MKYCVAIKLNDYSAEFSFDSNQEREEFIAVTRALHPEVEILLSEGSFQRAASA
jgi:hypothetical protein